MPLKHEPGFACATVDPSSQTTHSHAIEHADRASLEDGSLASITVSQGLIRIAAFIVTYHALIAGQSRRNAEFLLRPVDQSQAFAGIGPDKSPQPARPSHEEFAASRLISAGATGERAKARAMPGVGSDFKSCRLRLECRRAHRPHDIAPMAPQSYELQLIYRYARRFNSGDGDQISAAQDGPR
jgi:hypothetical protein